MGLEPHPAASNAAISIGRTRMKYVSALVIGLFVLAQSSQALPVRSGQVRVDRRAVADAGGPFNALGATLFWGAWGYKFERARLERNLATLRDAGVDYVRILGSVGGTSWADRQTDPNWEDYDAIIAGVTDLVYDRYAMRVQWTLFGGAPFTPAGAARTALVDRFARMARGREHKIFAFEIANEGSNNGFPDADGIAELRRLGRRLNGQTSVLVALSDPSSKTLCELYGDSGADVMTFHYPRSFGAEGPLRPLLAPWSSTSPGAGCAGKVPSIIFNNEPIGPESSVQHDDNPARIVAAYVMTFLAGNAAYVFHAGPGIRGGGKADVTSDLRRHAHFDELPTFNRIAAGLHAAKEYLPAGLANWQRQGPDSAKAPITGFERLYSASSGSEFVALTIGLDAPANVVANVSGFIDIRNAETGRTVERVEINAGKRFALPAGEAFVLIGRNRGN